ncbi:helix-turn-helix transcriptional regulator [Solirubrobacter phytolaccae]
MPPVDTLHKLKSIVRGRRIDLGLSQAEVAQRAEVSRQWVNAFERGKGSAELQLVLRLLDALDLHLRIDARTDEHTVASARVDLDALLDEHRHRD